MHVVRKRLVAPSRAFSEGADVPIKEAARYMGVHSPEAEPRASGANR